MSDLSVYIRPFFRGKDRGEGGIRRWVEAQHRYLPEYGIQPVDRIDNADIVACHAGDLVNTPKPLVAHNHGLYNTAHQAWSRWEWMLNQNVIEVMRRAKVVTVPSTWVSNQVARGLCIAPRVLYAGITGDEWEPGQNGKYILWNKTRVDSVCDPGPLNRLAIMNPRLKFITTFGEKRANVQITGRLPFHDAKALIKDAGLYLCTAKETFGIGTLEAMACGVPILGWAWGGQLDIVKHGEMGYLAEPGNFQELQHGLAECVKNREECGAAAREHVLKTFTWDHGMEECARIYRDAYAMRKTGPKISVIVTVYDLERYLPDCLVASSGKLWMIGNA